MTTPSSFGSLLSSRSGILTPLRVSVYLNGGGAGVGRRVVLDRSDTFAENVHRIAVKLGLADRSVNPKVYTKQGIPLDDIDEVIEGEVLFFDPRGQPFLGEEKSRTVEEVSLSFGSTAKSVDGASTVSSRRRRKQKRSSGGTYRTATEGRESFGSTASRTRENSFEYEYLFKFILVGSMAVGKSCLLLRFTDQRFRTTHETTIGVDFGSETVHVRDKNIKIQVWDTTGQEKFEAITRAYFREAAAALVVYDVTDRQSFVDLKQWLENVRSTNTNRALTITLIGNKCDKRGAERQVSSKEGETFARENGLLFLETSALSGENVKEAFLRTADAVLRKLEQGLINVDDRSQGVRRGDFTVDSATDKASTVTSQPYNLNVHGSSLGTEDSYQCYC